MMHFDFVVSIPDHVIWGGFAALIPMGILIALQLLMAAFMMSMMSLGGPVHFEPKVWGMVLLYVVLSYSGGAGISAIFGNWWSGGLAGLIVSLGFYFVGTAIDNRKRRKSMADQDERNRQIEEYRARKAEEAAREQAEKIPEPDVIPVEGVLPAGDSWQQPDNSDGASA